MCLTRSHLLQIPKGALPWNDQDNGSHMGESTFRDSHANRPGHTHHQDQMCYMSTQQMSW